MVFVYPVVFTPAKEGGYCVYVPDFDVDTQGKDMAEAIYMARDVIGTMGIYKEDEGQEIPLPTHNGDAKLEAGQLLSWIDIDFEEYRRKHDNRTERRNVSIPRWLNQLAKKEHVNVSELLTEALKEKLGVN